MKDNITKILSIIGTVLIWLPILAPLIFTILSIVYGHGFHFDYLMPAELFALVLVGGGLLIWAAIRARSHLRLLGWGLGIAAAALVACQTLAVVTGLASGAREPAGLPLALVLAALGLYILMVIVCGTGGIMLVRHLYE